MSDFPLHLLSEPVERWAAWFFDRRVSQSMRKRESFEVDGWLGDSELSAPEVILLEGLAELHERYAEWGKVYSAAQLDQGLWAMFSHPFFLGWILLDGKLPLAPRERAMRSLVVPYREYVAGWSPDEEMPHGWFMLWDLILSNRDEGDISDLALECLEEILAIPDGRCQSAALHGLGHLNHPDRPRVVQRWIDFYGQGLDRQWLESCRDGTVM